MTLFGRKQCVVVKQFRGTGISGVITASNFADTTYLFIVAPLLLSNSRYRTSNVYGLGSR